MAPGDADLYRRAAHTALDQAAHQLRADEPEWLTTWLGQRPTTPAAAAVWDDATTQIAHHRTLHNVPATEAGLGHHPDDHLGAERWQGCDHGDAKLRSVVGKPGGQAIVLAESGASAGATVAVLRAEGVEDRAIRQHMSASITDALGGLGPLFHPEEVKEALAAPRRVKELADELVADLLVSAGKHPAGALHLAKTSNQPSNVINLVEERLRRRGHPVFASTDRRAERGLSLIDEWTGRGMDAPGAQPTLGPKAPTPEAPPPPEPAA